MLMIWDVIDTGLLLTASVWLPFSYIGVIYWSLRSGGVTPVSRDRSQSSQRGMLRASLKSQMISAAISPSGAAE